MKVCKVCGNAPRMKMSVKRNSDTYPRCVNCQREYNKLRARTLRLTEKRVQLTHNVQLQRKGWRVCSACLRKKRLSEFSGWYGKSTGKLHKMCDTCLSRGLLSNQKDMQTFTPRFWRRKAYACNTTYRSRLKRIHGRIHTLQELPYVIKPQQLIKLYNTQVGTCCYCGSTLVTDNMACDHAQPISKGGVHHIKNIRLSCSDCNQLKADRNELEFSEFLKRYARQLLEVLDLRDKEPAKVTE